MSMSQDDPDVELLLVAGISFQSAKAIETDEAIRQTAIQTFALDTATYQVEVLSSQLKSSDISSTGTDLSPALPEGADRLVHRDRDDHTRRSADRVRTGVIFGSANSRRSW